MKVRTRIANGFVVTTSRGRDHGTAVPPLAAEMLHEALARAGVESGSYAFQVTGICPSLMSPSKHAMSVSPEKNRTIRINMKCGKSSASSITGLLRLPAGVDMGQLYQKLIAAAKALNEEHWKSMWHHQGKSDSADDAPVPLAGDGAKHEETASAVPSQSAQVTVSQETATLPVSSQVAVSDETDVLELILLEIWKHTVNGVFAIKAIVHIVYAHLPDRNRRGLTSSIIMKMKGLRWIRRTASGSWQVEKSFLDKVEIAADVAPLPVLAFVRKNAKKSELPLEGSQPVAGVPAAATQKATDPVSVGSALGKLPLASPDILGRLIVLRQVQRELADVASFLQAEQKHVSEQQRPVDEEIRLLTSSLSREDLLAIVLDGLS